jgi:hypothetical protein
MTFPDFHWMRHCLIAMPPFLWVCRWGYTFFVARDTAAVRLCVVQQAALAACTLGGARAVYR